LLCLSLHIPYRDSKLTHILKKSLGGNAKTAIICTITPAEHNETELTLKFALSVKKVKNRPVVNHLFDNSEERLRKKVKDLEEKLRHVSQHETR
ncbi:Centromere-associated protein E, partial [Geodia barretti]